MPGPRTAPRSRRTRARWSRSRGRDHRASIPEGAGPGSRPAAGHLTTAVRPAPRRHITSAVKAVVMARKRRAPNYTGALAKPIYEEDHYKFTGGLGQPIQETDVAAIGKRAVEKMWLLFEHYRIDPSDGQRWQKLAMSLAPAHVPGLQFARRPKRGPKPKWPTGLGDEWVRAVEDMKSRTGKGTEDAIAELQKEPMWERYTVENLGARYREARHRQKALASLGEAWLNEINIALGRAAPCATAPPLGRLHADD